MNILVLDPAESTGYAYIELVDGVAEINNVGFIEINKDQDPGDQYIELEKKIGDMIDEYEVDHVAVEDYFFSKFSANGGNMNCAYRAIIHMTCRKFKIPYTILNITLWKKFINGSSRPNKEQKKKWGAEPAKKLMTQESLWNKFGIKFPNHSISLKTGKPIKFRYDIVDAVGMAIFFLKIYMHADKIQYNVIVPNDVEFKKPPKTMFVY